MSPAEYHRDRIMGELPKLRPTVILPPMSPAISHREKVMAELGLDPGCLPCNRRNRRGTLDRPRHLVKQFERLCWALHRTMSYPVIARTVGATTHSTVIYAAKRGAPVC